MIHTRTIYEVCRFGRCISSFCGGSCVRFTVLLENISLGKYQAAVPG